MRKLFLLAIGILFSVSTKSDHDVPRGTGVGKTKESMAELKRQHFHGAFCVEYEYNWENSSPEIAQSIKFFNKTCDELVAADAKLRRKRNG